MIASFLMGFGGAQAVLGVVYDKPDSQVMLGIVFLIVSSFLFAFVTPFLDQDA